MKFAGRAFAGPVGNEHNTAVVEHRGVVGAFGVQFFGIFNAHWILAVVFFAKAVFGLAFRRVLGNRSQRAKEEEGKTDDYSVKHLWKKLIRKWH